MKDNINFKDVRLTIEQPSEKLSELIYDSFGYKGFKTPQKISQNLLEAKEAYELNEYFQYVIYFKNTPIGLLKMELIETKRGKSLNSGLRFNESRVYKMGLFIGDQYLMVNIISDVLYTFLSSSNLDKAILFATEVGDNRFKKSLKNNLFEDIVSCKYDEIVKNTENGSDCTFYFFKSDVDSFALNNKYVMNNRKKVLTLFQR